MPLKRRTRVPRRGRRSSFRKRRLTRRRRLVSRFKKRKTISRRTRLTQGFPRTSVATLKYVDVVTDISPQTHPLAPDQTPGLISFSANDPGQPDLGSVDRTDFPTLYSIKGSFPHQPLGYDQYTLLYQQCKVLRSSAKFTLSFASRDGYSIDDSISPATQYDSKGVDTVANYATSTSGVPSTSERPVATTTPLTQRFPAGLYVGVVRVNSLNPLALPRTYTEFLERFKAPLKFVPYRREQAAFKTVTLYGLYAAPSTKSLQSMVHSHDMNTSTNSMNSRTVDMLTTRTGDHYTPGTVSFRAEMRARKPVAQFAWQVVVYYPDSEGQYTLPVHSGFIDAVSLRATVNIRYRCLFSKLRMLKQSYLNSTPGLNEQPATDAGAGGVPTAGGGSAGVTSTDGIIDQVGQYNPNTQDPLPAYMEEVAQAP